MKILRIDSSAQTDGAHSRVLMDTFISKLGNVATVVERDLTESLPHVDAEWVAANNTAADDRSLEQNAKLSVSNALIDELEAADTLLIGLPIYNFGVPAALKAWIDQVCRAHRTFAYSQNGPVGLLEGKRAIVVYVSGGTPIGSDIDFASNYIRHIMGFIGITDVTFVAADKHMMDDTALLRATDEIKALANKLS
ncbi:FMN-dependent NADH-azoreductase [Octadecabacter antarcticus 307]|uniref:FMN dependent NADH:quinone oxidoreductase n=1 Tax=Octadecabacter antarcticus 307 TaxID=391626 RepID=M9RE27_9RHOB|nr:NAD(P)H-dependent oxidoreductase [Octadecabacter antarcticus]AGI68671.1 FMN-dependent NADH-azoreductase [Octadecabacter antarcticus 307]